MTFSWMERRCPSCRQRRPPCSTSVQSISVHCMADMALRVEQLGNPTRVHQQYEHLGVTGVHGGLKVSHGHALVGQGLQVCVRSAERPGRRSARPPRGC